MGGQCIDLPPHAVPWLLHSFWFLAIKYFSPGRFLQLNLWHYFTQRPKSATNNHRDRNIHIEIALSKFIVTNFKLYAEAYLKYFFY